MTQDVQKFDFFELEDGWRVVHKNRDKSADAPTLVEVTFAFAKMLEEAAVGRSKEGAFPVSADFHPVTASGQKDVNEFQKALAEHFDIKVSTEEN